MSTTPPTRSRATVQQYSGETAPASSAYDDERGAGWVTFAAVMLLILATVNLIQGIAAVSTSTFFVANAKFVLSGLNTWGWILILCAVAQGAAAVGIIARVRGVRWVGVGIASVNAIVQLLFISAYPFWSLSLFTLDILVIYGLIAYGKRVEA